MKYLEKLNFKEYRLIYGEFYGQIEYIFNVRKRETKNCTHSDPRLKETLTEINALYDLMHLFDHLQFGRNFKFNKDYYFSPSSILSSATSTLLSIEACIEYSNISDAFILSRRFCEDLYFYLYIATKYLDYEDISSSRMTMDDTISQWLENTLDKTDFNSKILGGISSRLELAPLVRTFELQKVFSKMRNQLNKYIHWNGRKYYNSTGDAKYEELLILIDILKNNIYYFLIMLALITPVSIMSSDYTDFFESGMTPPEGIQYEIAPFIMDFLVEESERIGDDSLKYLTVKSPMNFEN